MTVVSLEQIKQLDIRVKKAVTLIKDLTSENQKLKDRISSLETELQELKTEKDSLKAEEERLQVSLQGVLDTLDQVEDETAAVIPETVADNTLISPEIEPEIKTNAGTATENQTVQYEETVSVSESVTAEQNSEQEDTSAAEPQSAGFQIETELLESEQEDENVLNGVQEPEETVMPDSDSQEENNQEEKTDNVQSEPAGDSEPEIINLDSTDGELPEEDNSDSFQSEFDIF
jgi:FtsZ-binding cell division protein ZapB